MRFSAPLVQQPPLAGSHPIRQSTSASRRSSRLSADQPRLINEHPMKWVGVYRGEVSAKADDLLSLMRKLEKQGVPSGDAIIRFVERNLRTLIL